VKKQLWVVAMSDGTEVVAKAANLQVVVEKSPASGYPPNMPSSPCYVPEMIGYTGAASMKPQGMMIQSTPQHSCIGLQFDETPQGQQTKRIYAAPLPWRVAQTNVASCSYSDGSTSIGDSSSEGEGEAHATQAIARTTVMMRGIPNSFTRDMLIELLESQGFGGCFNLVCLPIDIQTEVACGYATITLFTHGDAERFRIHFEGFTDWPMVSDKVCRTSWSQIDGLLAHVERHRNSPLQHKSVPDRFKPVLFNKFGKRVPFPPPKKNISPPRFAATATTRPTKSATN
jgi:hypothetical protein